MKKNTLSVVIACCLLIACNPTKKSSSAIPDSKALAGNWELNYISGPRIAFDTLYPNKKPTISFDLATNKIAGNTSCNGFTGALKIDGNKINFNDPMAMTRMACPGEGETVFVETLKKINSWSVTNDTTLNLLAGDTALMRFTKR